MIKPKAFIKDPVYDYHEVIEYIEDKYNIKTRGYGRDNVSHFDKWRELFGEDSPNCPHFDGDIPVVNINGEIVANIVTIGGKVVGTVNAKEKLVLETKCVLKGDIITKVLVIEAGAKFDGKSNMGDVREVNSPNISAKITNENKTG